MKRWPDFTSAHIGADLTLTSSQLEYLGLTMEGPSKAIITDIK